MHVPITVDKDIQGGTPCFTGTRVPVASLFDHIEGGYTIDYFLSQFPSVSREQVLALQPVAHGADNVEAAHLDPRRLTRRDEPLPSRRPR